jgi:hypothetical protein
MSKLTPNNEDEGINLIVCIETHRNKSIGTLMRCAVAFGASMIVIVGSPKFSTHGAYEAKKFIRVMHFFYWKDCTDFVKKRGCIVYGISPRRLVIGVQNNQEIASDSAGSSYPIEEVSFCENFAAFIVGEKEGLTSEQISISDKVLHVSFPHQNLEEFVHYDSKIATCFHHYASSAGLSQRSRQGEKYTLQEVISPLSEGLKAIRIDKKPPPIDSEDGLSNLFGADD